MAISIVGTAVVGGSGTNGGDVTVTLPAGVAAGDVVWVWGGHKNTAATSYGPTAASPGFTQLYLDTSTLCGFGCWRRVLNGALASITCHGSGVNGDGAAYCAIVLRGASNLAPESTTSTIANGTTGSPNPAAITPGVAGAAVIIGAASTVSDAAVGTVANYTNLGNVNANGSGQDISGAGALRLSPGSPEDPPAWSAWANGTWRAITIAVAPGNPGTLGATESADTAALAGTVQWRGALAATEGSDTASLAGGVRWQGTFAAAESADGAAFGGTVASGANEGDLAVVEAGDAGAFAGTVAWGEVSCGLAVTEASDAAAIGGTVAWTGTLAASEGPDVAVLAGSVAWRGSLAATETADAAAIEGTVAGPREGTLGATEAADTAAFVGLVVVPRLGTLAAIEAADAAALAGWVGRIGILAAPEAADAMVVVTGAGSQPRPAQRIAASAQTLARARPPRTPALPRGS